MKERVSSAVAARQLRRAGRWVVVLFWTIQFVELTAVSAVEGRAYALNVLPERALIVAAGVLLTLALVEVNARLHAEPLQRQLAAALTSALILCVLQVGIAYLVGTLSTRHHPSFNLVDFVYTGFTWSWFFLSIAVALVALSYSVELRERETRLNALEIIARDASMAALRYQLNPHFLFNTLNSVAALIGRRDHEAAERMVEDLADFLRATLELDPHSRITLKRELDLQLRYLAVEQVRFEGRLHVRQDVPDDVGAALVPALITQPLVENVIRHAVARTPDPVDLAIAARRLGDALVITVDNDRGPAAGPGVTGTGVGLANVRARLAGLFGDEQRLEARRLPEGGFHAAIRMPFIECDE